MHILGKRPNPIGFISISTGFHPGLFVRLLNWHFSLKPTRCELFSQRYGYSKTYRFAGLSLSVRRMRDPA